MILLWAVLCLSLPVLAADAPLPQFSLTSPGWENNGVIPDRYTCRGADMSPALAMKNAPAGAAAFVLTVHDPEGSVGPWVHWLVYNIPQSGTEIKENSNPGTEALNDFGNFYYSGPCLMDERKHRFIFTMYALNEPLDNVTEGATMDTLLKAMNGRIMAKAEFVGVYQNPAVKKEP
ncbi:MAG: YbhB/YbcL family Raf kinase inhibitor-like protein [Candidatus Omnitrophica bacterium]|nr:YbhB/YbcL family Raf kinase inhibitor-like protein [Candidatus Omnitrophota bacterium]